jgi:putative FmdB family regulatory protein
MPIYEYRCQSCDHELEVMQKLSDPELSDCPTCGKPALKKLISVVGFRLKGGGWYETDFKGGSTQKKTSPRKMPRLRKVSRLPLVRVPGVVLRVLPRLRRPKREF